VFAPEKKKASLSAIRAGCSTRFMRVRGMQWRRAIALVSAASLYLFAALGGFQELNTTAPLATIHPVDN